MKEKILISLLAIALVSGCTGISIPGIGGTTTTTTTAPASGLEITSFTAEPDTAYNGTTVRISMDVQNLGGATAYDAKSFAFLSGSNIKITGSSTADDAYWHRLAGDTTTQEIMTFGKDMKPADVVKGTEGDTKPIKWSLRAPDLGRGQTRTDTLIGRVYADYQTVVNGNVWVYSEAESDAARTSGRTLNKASFTSSSGPIAAEVSVNPDPVVIYGSDKTFSMTIKLSIAQTGATIYTPGIVTSTASSVSTDDLNKVSLTVTAGDFVIAGDCKVGSSATTTQELVNGKPTTIVCDMTAPTVTTFKSFPVSIKVDYGYYTEKEVSVTVQGK